MGKHKPRSGSLAFYPRKRAEKITPSFSSFNESEAKEAKPLNFLGYKAGMTHVFALNLQQKSPNFNQEIMVPATVIECPPLKVYGARIYSSYAHGMNVKGDILSEKVDKEFLRKVRNFKKKKEEKGKKGEEKSGKKEEKEGKGKQEEKNKLTFSEIEKIKPEIADVRLLVYTQPRLTGIGKKKPDLTELGLSGSIDQKLAFAKEKLGNEIKASDAFNGMQLVDVKSVTIGKGFQGVVKRAGVKVHRPKAKRHRYVGSIGPWHPPTVMWTVARPGQLGFQSRTEFNKVVLMVSKDASKVNPKAGFNNYGLVKNEFVLLTGSVPGPEKRPINIRTAIRPDEKAKPKLSEITEFSYRTMKGESK